MKSNPTILTQYRDSTADERLTLYVFHRQLRDAFNEIDLEDDGAWGDEKSVVIALPRLVDIWAATKKVFQGRTAKLRAPIHNRIGAHQSKF